MSMQKTTTGRSGVVTPNNNHTLGVRNRHAGLFLGVVEYNIDILKIGRCKVRVPQLHGTEVSIETEDLPWAVPITLAGGLHDAGSHAVPSVGSYVYVLYLMEDTQSPVYFGGWFKNPSEPLEANTKTSKVTGKVLPERPISMGKWMQPIGPEAPGEVLATPYEPTTKILFKSEKGHTILLDDRDGYEKIRIIDRVGQELVFHCGVTDGDNKANAARRGTHSVSGGDPIPSKKLESVATVELLGKNGAVKIVSRGGSEHVELVSRDDTGQSEVRVLLGGGLGTIQISGKQGGKETVKIQADCFTGAITLEASDSITISTEMITLLTELLQVRGDMSVDGDLSVRGNTHLSGDVSDGNA